MPRLIHGPQHSPGEQLTKQVLGSPEFASQLEHMLGVLADRYDLNTRGFRIVMMAYPLDTDIITGVVEFVPNRRCN